MQATWRVEMLGGMRAVSEDATISQFRTHNVELLLAMLAIKPGQPLAREVLGERLWPGEETPCQLERLRYVKSRLGAALGGDPFEKSGNLRLALRPGAVGSDVAEFDAALLAAEARTAPSERLGPLRTAADLYRGELLPGFYDDWSNAERERLREARFDVLSGLVRDLEATGQLDEAVPWRRTLAAEFPERSLAARPVAVASPGAVAIEGSFFGRDAEREAVIAWFDRGVERVLTLVGPGGMGKTRLAREAMAGRDAAFVSLAELTDAGKFFEALHGALGLPRQGADLRAQTLAHLRASERPFLILDNLEQIADKIGSVLRDLLRSVPGLRLLATSRKRLNLSEERVFALNPLPGGPSVALFLDRAQRLRPDFAQTPESRALVGEICALLEGLPLAIELAAARTVVLGPAQIKAQLARRLGFLVNRRHAPVERHRSLRVALDWSIELLSPEQRRVFARLSVFRGGFTLEQAEAVAADPAISVLDALDDLHAHSLLSVRFDESGEARYDLLVVIREYAEELLEDFGESESASAKHLLAFDRFVEDCCALASREALVQRLQTELDNVRAAIAYSIRRGDSAAIYRFLHRIGGVFFEMGLWQDMKALLDALEDISLDATQRLRYVSLQGALARRQGREDDAERWWTEWLERAEVLGDAALSNWILFHLIQQCLDRNRLDEAKSFLDRIRDDQGSFDTLVLQACWASRKGDHVNALRAAQDFLSEWRKSEQSLLEATSYFQYLFPVWREAGEAERSLSLARELLLLEAKQNNLFHIALIVFEIAESCEKLGILEDAEAALRLSVAIHRDLGSRQQTRAEQVWKEYCQKYGIVDVSISSALALEWRKNIENLSSAK